MEGGEQIVLEQRGVVAFQCYLLSEKGIFVAFRHYHYEVGPHHLRSCCHLRSLNSVLGGVAWDYER